MRPVQNRILPLLILLACLLPVVQAAGFDYDVKIEAPAEAKKLLQANLTLLRIRGQERTSAEQVLRLADTTADEARDLLATIGYFSPKIDVRYQSAPDTAQISLLVELGEPVRVKSVVLRLTGPASEIADAATLKQAIDQLWTLPAGSIYIQSAWNEGKNIILRPLYDRAYANANLKLSEARVDVQAKTADLTLEIESGAAYRFGQLNVRGIKHYPEYLVREQAPFKPGDDYRRSELTDLQTNLQRLPHFTLALVDAKPSDTAPYEVPVSVEIQEAPRHRLQPGIGYNSNTGLKGELAYRYLNVAERGWVSETKFSIEQLEQSAETSLTFPPANAGYEYRIYAGYGHSDLEGVDSKTWTTGIVREQGDFKLTRSLGLEYQAERRELNSGKVERPKTTALKYQWIRRDVDSPRDPRSGRLLQWETAGAVSYLASEETFVRVYGRVVEYWPLSRYFNLQARAEAGETFARDETDVPTDWLFRTGGSSSVRGYDYQSLGVQKSGSIVPGRVMAVGSLELQIPLKEQWRVALFVDHGNAALRWNELRGVTGAGLGLRWISPVGVIGIDAGHGFDYDQWRLHIALGLVF